MINKFFTDAVNTWNKKSGNITREEHCQRQPGTIHKCCGIFSQHYLFICYLIRRTVPQIKHGSHTLIPEFSEGDPGIRFIRVDTPGNCTCRPGILYEIEFFRVNMMGEVVIAYFFHILCMNTLAVRPVRPLVIGKKNKTATPAAASLAGIE